MFVVLEMQTNGGKTSTLVTTKDKLNEAESVYYQILAAAAISKVEVHTAVLMRITGETLYFRSFDRTMLEGGE